MLCYELLPLRKILSFWLPTQKVSDVRPLVFFCGPCLSLRRVLCYGSPPLRKEQRFASRSGVVFHPIHQVFPHAGHIYIFTGTTYCLSIVILIAKALSSSSCRFLEPVKDLAVGLPVSRCLCGKLSKPLHVGYVHAR